MISSSGKIFPACGNLCICCPALRSRSRHPVKRYKKLIAEIFPKSHDGQINERKLGKLCEYAAKNPLRIPKITKYLEERFYRELRSGHVKIVNIVCLAYVKLLSNCRNQLAYFVGSVLNITTELLDSSKQEALSVAGCQVLTNFIYNQTDGTYAHSIESMAHQVAKLARETGDEHQKLSLRASSMQCLAAMIWFMAAFSHFFIDLAEVVNATLHNYARHTDNENGDLDGHHHWVDEVIRYEGRGAAAIGGASPSSMPLRPRPEKKDSSVLTREEIECPKVWARICLQRLAELAKESSTMRRFLEPMFVYFDTGHHWIQNGLATTVLSDLCYFTEFRENQLLVLSSVVRHLDHKNVSRDPLMKSYVVQVSGVLAQQIRVEAALVDAGSIGDLCRHMRKSLQATAAPIGSEETNLNVQLQNAIEACLIEIVKGIKDARPLHDLMVIILEKLPPVEIVAKATVYSLIILANAYSLVSHHSHSQQAVPEALILQLLKAMLHPTTEARIGTHQLFWVLLANQFCHDASTGRSGNTDESRNLPSSAISSIASASALLEKLRKEKYGDGAARHVNDASYDSKGNEDHKQGWTFKSSPNFCKLTSIIEQTTGSLNINGTEPSMMMLGEDQVMLLLSGFWVQATLPDNAPEQFEAIVHSYTLTLVSSLHKNTNQSLAARFFHLALSLRSVSLDPNYGTLPPACRRSILVASTSLLMLAAKIHKMHDLIDLLKSHVPHDVDPYLGINDDFQLFVKRQVDLRKYGSATDDHEASSVLNGLQDKKNETDKLILALLSQHLCSVTTLTAEDVLNQLSGPFPLDDIIMFASQPILELDHIQFINQSNGAPAVNGELSANSAVEVDETSYASATNASAFAPNASPSSSMPNVISIGKLLESALEVAVQVAGTSISNSPLSYSTITTECEALEISTRKKLLHSLVGSNNCAQSAEKRLPAPLPNGMAILSQIASEEGPIEGNMNNTTYSALRLPPASPFENFLKIVPESKPEVQKRLFV
ncbi:SEMI-ROLLED LEAF 2-like protein [Drosera capensis]